MNKISIIIPVYNSEKYLDKCLNSIINQTYKNIEIILVNDGSTDNSKDIINNYLCQYPDIIKYFSISHSGVANARNFGISKITGNYFIFVDSDDYIELDLISSLNNIILLNPDIDIVKYKMQVISSKCTKKISGPVFSLTTGENAFNLLCFDDVLIDTPCLYLIKTDFYRLNNFKFLENTYREDYGLIPLLIVSAGKFVSADLYGYNYFNSDNSIMRNADYNTTLKKVEDMFLHYEHMTNFINSKNLSATTITNIKQYYTNGILLAFKTLNKTDRKKYIIKFKNNKMINNIVPRNLKQIIKKILLKISINMYLHLI